MDTPTFCPHCGNQVAKDQLIDQTTRATIICAGRGFHEMKNSKYLGSLPKEEKITMWDTEGKILTSICASLIILIIVISIIKSGCDPDLWNDIFPPFLLEYGQPLTSESIIEQKSDQEKQLDKIEGLMWFNLLK